MKKFRVFFSVLFIITAFSLHSCGPDEVLDGFEENTDSLTDPTAPGTAGSFQVDFSGATWIATKIEASIINNEITIVAENAKGESFIIGVVDGVTAGVYPANANGIGFNPAGSEEGYWSLNPDNPDENTGSVTISSVNTSNKTISGTFNFKGYWDDGSKEPINFIKGVFKDIPYSTDTNPITIGSSEDTFSAKVDGTEFVENDIDFAEVDASGVSPYYSIVGKKTNGDNIGIRIAQSLSIGTYSITGVFGSDNVGGSSLFDNVLYNAESGSITITTKTATKISGTFNYIGKNFTTGNTKSITAGTFSIEL